MDALVFVFLVSVADALIKGNIMARKEWNEINDFWKQSSFLYPSILFASTGILGLMYAFAKWDEWYLISFFMFESLLLGSLGLESLLYWWSLKPLGIKQKAFWKKGTPPASWFDYPDKAPWLNDLFPLVWLRDIMKEKAITRDVVFVGSVISLMLYFSLELIKFFIFY